MGRADRVVATPERRRTPEQYSKPKGGTDNMAKKAAKGGKKKGGKKR